MITWRTIGSFFLLLLVATPLLFLSFLQAKQTYIRHSLEERLEASFLKTLLIPKQELHYINPHELLIDGKLFDIKELQQTGNGYLVTGVFDEDETTVMQQIDNACKGQASKNNALFSQAFQLMNGLFFQATDEPLPPSKANAKLFQNPIAGLPVLYKKVLSPPPQAPEMHLIISTLVAFS